MTQDRFALREVTRVEGSSRRQVIYLTCPVCKKDGELDDDQFHGRVSVDCILTPGCTFHETRDFSSMGLL